MVAPNVKLDESYAADAPAANAPTILKFVADLGRGLQSATNPRKVAERVAEFVSKSVGAEFCVVVAELEHIGLINCVFDRAKKKNADCLNRRRFENWLAPFAPQISYQQRDRSDFLCDSFAHTLEYVSPLVINGEVKGAIIVGFKRRGDCAETVEQMIDAAAQMTAMSLNLSARYETTINASVHIAREEHRRFTESVLDSLPVSIYVIDRDFRIVMWNRHREVGLQGIPRDMVIGRDVFEVLAKYPQGQLRREFERAFRTGNIERIEQRTTDEDGTTKHWMVSKVPMRDETTGVITHVITVGEDVTVRVEAIHAVGRAEKLAAVGRLAAGVVHEINNPLATISACAEALESRVEEGAFSESAEIGDLREYLELIRSEAFRCKSITTSLLDFSRPRSAERTTVDIAEILQSSARLVIHQKRGERVNFKYEIGADLPLVNADAGQIQQVIIALATNAIDAMPDGGTLTFRAVGQPNRLIVEIQDTGIGIPPENVAQIFEPFFTTKEVGKGTGLGLSVCYGIVTEHGGRLSVRSSVETGTTFSIFLPIENN